MKIKMRLISSLVIFLSLTLGNQIIGFSINVETKTDKKADKEAFTPKLKVSGRVQSYWDFTLNDTGTGTGWVDENSATPYIKRFRLKASGEIVENVHFLGEIRKEPRIHKAYMKFTHLKPFANVIFGFQDIPFNRSFQLTSSGNLLMTDRANSNTKYAFQRDLGLMLNGSIGNDLFHYWAGLFKGRGEMVTSSDDGDNTYLAVARIQIDPLGKWKNGKTWFSKDLRASVGGGFFYQAKTEPDQSKSTFSVSDSSGTVKESGPKGNLVNPASQLKDIIGVTGDIGFNWNIIYLEGAITYFTAKSFDPASAGYEEPEPYLGIVGDIGITIIPKHLLMTGRFDYWDDKPLSYAEVKGGTGNKIIAISGGFTWYVGGHKHTIKLQPEIYYELKRDDANEKRLMARLGATLNF